MRPIKFRAWEINSDSWATDLVYIDSNGDPIAYGLKPMINMKGKIIVSQFTGLHDKNGKEIYEGDIVKYLGKTMIVGFANGHFMIHEGKTVEDIFTHNHEDLHIALRRYSRDNVGENIVEIIGNIYDNPGLLD
jgi:uncharacterized phage protein (TIGR01671 family)